MMPMEQKYNSYRTILQQRGSRQSDFKRSE
jgi:hypothetical protein